MSDALYIDYLNAPDVASLALATDLWLGVARELLG